MTTRTLCDACIALVEAALVELAGALGDGATCAVCGAPEGHASLALAVVDGVVESAVSP